MSEKKNDKTSTTQTRNIEGIFKRQTDTFPCMCAFLQHHIKKCLNLVCTLGHKTAYKNAKYFMVLIFYDVEIFGVLFTICHALPLTMTRSDEEVVCSV